MQHIKRFAVAVFATAGISISAEPLSDFKELVRQCSSDLQSKPSVRVFFIESSKQWAKRINAKPEIAYDVKKTDSLVSPYTGFIEVTEMIASKVAADEAAANLLAPSFNDVGTVMLVHRLNFRYAESDNKWSLVDGKAETRFKTVAGDRFEREPMRIALSKDSATYKTGAVGESCASLKKP